jgi:hypothetical protein
MSLYLISRKQLMLSSNSIDWTRMMTETEKNELVNSPEFRDWLIGLLADNNKSTIITFLKKDGTLRKMPCTRNPSKIPVEHHPKTETTDPSTSIRVFDLEKNEWRSFLVANVKSVNYEF